MGVLSETAQPIVAATEPDESAQMACVARTLLKTVADMTGQTFEQAQAAFKARWNADFPDQQLT